jgi:hypothetical protein
VFRFSLRENVIGTPPSFACPSDAAAIDCQPMETLPGNRQDYFPADAQPFNATVQRGAIGVDVPSTFSS